jgi:hypothetical protein
MIWIFIITVLLFLFFFNKREQFTPEQQQFATNLISLFRNEQKPSFVEYLQKLNELQNVSDNLISKGVYNKLLENNNLQFEDIIPLM